MYIRLMNCEILLENETGNGELINSNEIWNFQPSFRESRHVPADRFQTGTQLRMPSKILVSYYSNHI